ncbi:MAG: hypothetical protein Q4Q07_04570 [Tissierellia bacterium]|nr:hypothetical protein [Tissierellia bacterium]
MSKAVFREDNYAYIYRHYAMDKETFHHVLGSDYVYNYLEMLYAGHGKEKAAPETILEDIVVPIVLRKRFEKAIFRDYITIGQDRVRKQRSSLINYAVRKFAKKDINEMMFKKQYLDLVKTLGLEDVGNIGCYDRGMQNRLAASHIVLWKYGRMLRYYNQANYDFTELLETLDLNQYHDEEYSSMKLFRDHPELMKNYDIHDEYELHNLLKKICSEEEYPEITFKRMPVIEFGEVDRAKQVKELLYELAPIGYYDFAEAYEEKYGVMAVTVRANYLQGIEEYLSDKEYVIDFPRIPESAKSTLIEALHEDFYLKEDLIPLIQSLVPSLSRETINPRSIKTLGFLNYENYVVRDTFLNGTQYFNHLLTAQDEVDLSEIDGRIKKIPNFSALLYRLRSTYTIIEYQPDKYVSLDSLREQGITEDHLRQYIDSVLDFVGDGIYFTITSLRADGFTHALDKLNYDAWFYASVLAEHREKVSYIRVGKNKILRTGDDFEMEDFLESIVYGCEDMYMVFPQLTELLHTKYAVLAGKHYLRTIIDSSGMHYDRITNTVYAHDELYFQTVQEQRYEAEEGVRKTIRLQREDNATKGAGESTV